MTLPADGPSSPRQRSAGRGLERGAQTQWQTVQWPRSAVITVHPPDEPLQSEFRLQAGRFLLSALDVQLWPAVPCLHQCRPGHPETSVRFSVRFQSGFAPGEDGVHSVPMNRSSRRKEAHSFSGICPLAEDLPEFRVYAVGLLRQTHPSPRPDRLKAEL
jgi:hypothetical protein